VVLLLLGGHARGVDRAEEGAPVVVQLGQTLLELLAAPLPLGHRSGIIVPRAVDGHLEPFPAASGAVGRDIAGLCQHGHRRGRPLRQLLVAPGHGVLKLADLLHAVGQTAFEVGDLAAQGLAGRLLPVGRLLRHDDGRRGRRGRLRRTRCPQRAAGHRAGGEAEQRRNDQQSG